MDTRRSPPSGGGRVKNARPDASMAMPLIPSLLSRLYRVRMGALVLCLSVAGVAHAAKPAPPALRIPLEPIGFTPVSQAHLLAGQTMFTLNFVDATHLLLTYHIHGLMPRLPDATPDDDDRFLDAVLLELPTGKVLARTRWRTRDHDRYLWALGKGRFLLRNRNRLALIDPLRNFVAGNAFHEEPFVDMKRRIGLVDVSPAGDLISVETIPPRKAKLTGAAASAAALARTEPDVAPEQETGSRPLYTLHFFRLLEEKPGSMPAPDRLLVQSAGSVSASSLVRVALTAEGYLTTTRESAGVFLFDFHTHTGKTLELSPFDTSCQPHAFFTGPTDFVAFGCRGAEDKLEFSAFNLRGEEPWVQVLTGDQLSASIVSAPAAGRFAFERTLSPTAPPPDGSQPLGTPAQEISVFQHADGRTLLKVLPTPTQVAGQNYDLSPDGMTFASIQNGAIVLYALPEMTIKDRKELERSRAVAPEKSIGAIRLNASPVKEAEESAPPPPTSIPTGAAAVALDSKPAASVPETPGAETKTVPARTIENGDTPPDGEPQGQRKAPTLYDPAHPKSEMTKKPERP